MIPDTRLDELFVRYWDESLSPSQMSELADCLRADATARAKFRILCEQAVTAADLPDPPIVATRGPSLNRRVALKAGLAGAATGLVAGAG